MAGVSAAGTLAQIGLIGELRWRLLRNSLGSVSARFDLILKVFVTLLGALIVVGIGLALGVVAFLSVAKGRMGVLYVLLWGIFLAWQVLPLLLAAMGPEFDFRNLLRFPLRFPAFFLLSLMYGLFDPIALSALFWLGCVGFAVFLAKPGLLVWLVPALGILAAAALILNRLFFAWLERWLARRRTREILFVVFIFSMLSVQFVGVLGERWVRGKQVAPYLVKVLPVLQALPPGLAGKALSRAAGGDALSAAASCTFLLAYGAGFALLLRRRLLAQYRGEDSSEAEIPSPAAAERSPEAVSAASPLSIVSRFFPGAVAALVEKELRYLLRNAPVLVQFGVPFFLVAFLGISWQQPAHRPGFLSFSGTSKEMLFPAAVAYAFIVFAPLAHNSFAFEGRGLQCLLMAPVRFREILLAKNVALGLMILLQAAGVCLVVNIFFGGQNPMVIAATFAALPFAALSHFLVGNLLSLYFPRRFDFGRFRQRQAGMTVVFVILLQVVVLAVGGLIFSAARLFGQMWMAAVAFVVLSAALLQVYVLSLDHCDRLGLSRREVLTTEICRD